MKPTAKKPPRTKAVHFELIARDSVSGHPMYVLLEELVAAHHQDLEQARIALAWCTSWRPDADGHCVIGKCRKASDLDRELVAYDFVILLSRGFWRDERVKDTQRRALLDHELCHAALKYDAKGQPVKDDRGRYVYRLRKHDVEEFSEIVARHGCYKADLEAFAAALRKQGAPKYEACERCRDLPGWVAVVGDDGVSRLQRCECYKQWAEQRADLLSA